MKYDLMEVLAHIDPARLSYQGWLNVGMANTLDELKAACPKFADTRCVRNGYVYNNNARTNAAGGNDYYESAIVNPDLLLRDLVKIFHPELVEEDFVYYKQLK